MTIAYGTETSGSTASGTAHEIPRPSSTSTGDLLIVFLDLESAPGTVTFTDWDLDKWNPGTSAIIDGGLSMYYAHRIVEAGDPTTFTVTTSLTCSFTYVVARWTGDFGKYPIRGVNYKGDTATSDTFVRYYTCYNPEHTGMTVLFAANDHAVAGSGTMAGRTKEFGIAAGSGNFQAMLWTSDSDDNGVDGVKLGGWASAITDRLTIVS